jgi:hypothetical protein
MIMSPFIGVVVFSFVVVIVVVIDGTNTYAQSTKVKDKLQESEVASVVAATEIANMTEKMKYLCIQIDASASKDQIKDKERQA